MGDEPARSTPGVLSPLDHRATGLWPLPLPHPRALEPGRRCRTRHRAVNMLAIVLTWLALGSPWHAPE
eukprot:1391943-Lingulodinium_polyedra.AAC.1